MKETKYEAIRDAAEFLLLPICIPLRDKVLTGKSKLHLGLSAFLVSCALSSEAAYLAEKLFDIKQDGFVYDFSKGEMNLGYESLLAVTSPGLSLANTVYIGYKQHKKD